jgi:hypothetical protein
MYGPNCVKLSRTFAVQLFSMSIEHHTTYHASSGPIRSPLAPQPCHHRLHSPRPSPSPMHCNTRCSLATKTSAVATTTCLDYLHSHTSYLNDERPSTASPVVKFASPLKWLLNCSSRAAPGPGVPLDEPNRDRDERTRSLRFIRVPWR